MKMVLLKKVVWMCSASLLLVWTGCTKNNPDNVLNPESSLYVGDSLANLDANGNGIADVLENQPGCTEGDLACGASQAAVSQEAELSSKIEISSMLQSSSAELSSATSSELASSSLPSSSSSVGVVCAADEVKLSGVGAIEMVTSQESVCAKLAEELMFLAQPASGQLFQSWSALPSGLSLVAGGSTSVSVKVKVTSLAIPELLITAVYLNTSSSSQVASSSSAMANNVSETEMIDTRDQTSYVTKKVGSLIWMMTNLAYNSGNAECATIAANSITISSDPQECKSNGRYYDWAAAVSGAGVCPGGWRLPTAQEFISAHASLDLKNSGVIKTTSVEVFDTGFFWTSTTSADAISLSGVSTDCYTSTCGVTYISHEGNSASFYPQINKVTESLPVRCVR